MIRAPEPCSGAMRSRLRRWSRARTRMPQVSASLQSLRVGAVFGVGRVDIDLTSAAAASFQVGLGSLWQLGSPSAIASASSPPLGSMPLSVAGSSDAVVSPRTVLSSCGSSASISRARPILRPRRARCPRRHFGPWALLADLGLIGRGPPRCSLGGYWTGASVPITGDLGSDSGLDWRISGYSSRAARLPRSTSLSAGPAGFPTAIGARGRAAPAASVPCVYTSPMRALIVVLGKFLSPAAARPGRGPRRGRRRPRAAFLTRSPSSRSTPASSCSLIAVTTPLTGALFSTISPTCSMTSSRPAVIFPELHDHRDEVDDRRGDDQDDGDDRDYGCRFHHSPTSRRR